MNEIMSDGKLDAKKIVNQGRDNTIGFYILIVFVAILFMIFPEKENAVEPVLSMKDLGFETSFLNYSYLLNNDTEYYFKISDAKDSEITFVLEISACKSETVADSLLRKKIKSIKKLELEFADNCTECMFYENEQLNILNFVYKLNKNNFDYDEAYSLYKTNEIPEGAFVDNSIFLLKDNMVITIIYHNSIKLDDHINSINNAIKDAISFLK